MIRFKKNWKEPFMEFVNVVLPRCKYIGSLENGFWAVRMNCCWRRICCGTIDILSKAQTSSWVDTVTCKGCIDKIPNTSLCKMIERKVRYFKGILVYVWEHVSMIIKVT